MLDDVILRHLQRSCAFLLLALAACGGEADEAGDDAPAASASIVAPADGATVPATFPVTLRADGFTVEAAGGAREGAGHFHVVVDGRCLPAGEQIPADETHVHLADGSAETDLTLPAGEHTLCLQAGDGEHVALGLTDEISVTVAGGDATETGVAAEGDQLEGWEGTYEGEVVWDCGAAGTHRGRVEATVQIGVWEETSILYASHTISGSCADTGELTTPISVGGIRRTETGFTIPSELWGIPGSFTLRTNAARATGRLHGEIPGPATLTIVFDLRCTFGC